MCFLHEKSLNSISISGYKLDVPVDVNDLEKAAKKKISLEVYNYIAGVKAVCMGRPFAYGLVIAGERGVSEVL